MQLIQVNLQTGFGGGEIYTCFLSQALTDLGQPFDLIVSNGANWWRDHVTGARHIRQVTGAEDLVRLDLTGSPWLIFHTPDRGGRLAEYRRQGWKISAFAHMPAYQRDVSFFQNYDVVFAVSKYVLDGLHDAGLKNVYPEPLYGIAHLERGAAPAQSIRAQSRFQWDTRKGRDRFLSLIHPYWRTLSHEEIFTSRPGLTLGIVSRITPIKQFPVLFGVISSVLREFPTINVEIFGAGGYASVRDLRKALRPIASQVRWWGHQSDVKEVYPRLDYLLTGLPEKEALGLNVIESQLCGTPVLAPDAPPFSETIVNGSGGYLYVDPRIDRGKSFRLLMEDLTQGKLPKPNPMSPEAKLLRFSRTAFTSRVRGMLDYLDQWQQ